MLLLAMKKILKSPSRLEEGPMVDECGELEVHRVVGQHLGTKCVMVAVLALEATTFAPTRGGIAVVRKLTMFRRRRRVAMMVKLVLERSMKRQIFIWTRSWTLSTTSTKRFLGEALADEMKQRRRRLWSSKDVYINNA